MSTNDSFCASCGSALESGQRFCATCGEQVLGVGSTADPATASSTLSGRFRLRGVLGRGAAGTVYLAVDESLGQEVAVKSLDPALAVESEFRARLRAESTTLAALVHPNIVNVRDYFEDADGAYLVMDRIEGASLRQLLSSFGHLTAEQTCGVLSGALSGLAFAHDRGLLHGDLKPENVLVDRAGLSKLSDFGQAVPLGSVASGGSVPYMSPEALRGAPLDARSDLYSMGAVLFECLAGRSAFVADQVPTLVHQILHEPAPSISGVPEPMSALLTHSLAKDPSGRPQSAREMLAELTDAANRSYGADWAARAGVAALSGAVAVGVALEAGAAPSGPAAVRAATTSTGTTTPSSTPSPDPTRPLGQSASDAVAPSAPGVSSARWLPRTLAGHKAMAAVLAAVVLAGAAIGIVLGTQNTSKSTQPASGSTSPTGAVVHSKSPGAHGVSTSRRTASLPSTTPAVWRPASFQFAASSLLEGVACAKTTHCVAVGSGPNSVAVVYVSADGGATWTTENPSIPGSSDGGAPILSAVACPSRLNCVAVGGYGDDSGAFDGGFILTTADGGQTWSNQTVAGGVPFLNGVACPTANECIAVGGVSEMGGTGNAEIVATHNGGSEWTRQTPPDVPVDLSEISCPSSSTCYAIGQLGPGIVDTTNGGQTWTSGTLPAGDTGSTDSTSSQFNGLSCLSPLVCILVGQSTNGAAISRTTDGGRSWNTVAVPAGLSGPNARLDGVDCFGGHDCVAVGASTDVDVPAAQIVGTSDDGLDWTSEQGSNEGDVLLQNASCVSLSVCAAVGSSEGGSGAILTTAAQQGGSSGSGSTGITGGTGAGTEAGASPNANASGGGSGASGGSVGGAASPEAAVSGYLTALKDGEDKIACSYTDLSDQAGCESALQSSNYSVSSTGVLLKGQVIQGSRALVSIVGQFCISVGAATDETDRHCASNSTPSTGMPTSGRPFSAAYTAALNQPSEALSPVPCVKVGSAWYVNSSQAP
jgi:hypothetical protein